MTSQRTVTATAATTPTATTTAAEAIPERDEEWRDDAATQLMEAIAALPDRAAAERFFRDLCTLRELDEMAQRWRVAQLLEAGWHYLPISRETGVSTATVTRISQWLRHGTGGYAEALSRGAGTGTLQGSRSEPQK
jgi:TrpR-related protein YerC/YecD